MAMQSMNPANGELLDSFNEHSWEDVSEILNNVASAQANWRRTRFSDRSALMLRAAAVLRERKEEFARMMTLEMGKPIAQSNAEVEKCAWVCEYYAEHAEAFLGEKTISTDASQSYVRYDPLGVVLAVMPWNFPFWQVFRFAAPAIMAGNAGVLKHASNVQGCALLIEEVFKSAGFPENLFRTLLIGSGLVGKVLEHPAIAAATLTGSDPAGRAVAKRAGELLKKTVLELGGSDPYIVLKDADIESCAKTAVTARMLNTGQSCIAAKRFIVVHDVVDEFTEQFMGLMRQQRMGNPMDPDVDVGPMARMDLVDELHDQVLRSVEEGAKLLLGGQKLESPGAYYQPTILGAVRPGMPAFDEETFGPVAAIIEADSVEDALMMANASEFGLGASLWTSDLELARDLARRIDAGCVFINGLVKSDPRLPFGGIKNSGYGRELSKDGILEFVNVKTVWIA
jgi:succinate-semialdehyde dehydrogenase / glutarate-semialdehyde dehydrogenase